MRSITSAIAVVVLCAPALGAAEATNCAALLTSAELKAAAGTAFEDMGPEDRGEGESLCSWMARGAGGFKSVGLGFWAGKGADFFETSAASTEEAAGARRETLAGVGGRAALVRYEDQYTAYVQTAGGVARLVTNGLGKPQVVAIAKAVAGPAAAAVAIPTPERIEGAAILAHPIGALALDYARKLHATGGDMPALSTRAALARRQALPKDERAESDAFLRKTVPAAGALEAAIRRGGVLIVEGPRASLNLVRSETVKNPDGSITASSSTSNMPFEMEDGAWKVAQ